ncbi:hypothetical protein DdX_16193 [Ditylenchus destructor]|uniref:Uncharacterized protein n=1 Tax=Ditylenchus destructor TaxID=166010 RepID=A0AAD4MND5_9BILA|nr:hypothetical protein DdX_16193 [Ditylenchus destructor]
MTCLNLNPFHTYGFHTAKLTENDMLEFESISHMWKNGELWFVVWDPKNDTETAYVSSAFNTIFSRLKLLGLREVTLRESNFKFVPELAYESIYRNAEVLNVRNFFEDLNAPSVLNLIKSKYKSPDSRTCFVYHYSFQAMQLGEMLKTIRFAFTKSIIPHSYILAVVQMNRYVFSKIYQQVYPRGLEMDEFRLENKTTKEALQLKKFTTNELNSRFNIQVTPDKCSTVFLLERFSL